MANMILRLPAVKVRTGLSRSAIYLQISEGTFPKQISLGAKAIGWLESDVENWVCQKVELSRSEP
jgi:prophage regulatory protein